MVSFHDEFHVQRPRRNNMLPIGFTPIPNKRINGAIATIALRLLKEGKAPALAHAEALRQVARTLSPRPFGRCNHRVRPSKSDDPAYRKTSCA